MGSVVLPPEADRRVSFEEFFTSELATLEAVAQGLTGRRALAQELAQEAMLVVYRRWEQLVDYEDPGAFARRVVINRSVSTFRRSISEARALARVGERADIEVVPPERDDELWRQVRALPARQAQAVVLRYVADLDTASIAETLGCAESTVRVLLHRARQALSNVLGHEYDTEAADEP